MTLTIGMLCFGAFIGYLTYRTLIRTVANTSINDLTVIIGVVGGGAVTTIVRPGTSLFGWYAIGLLIGFVGYALLFWRLNGNAEFAKVMGHREEVTHASAGPNAPRRRD